MKICKELIKKFEWLESRHPNTMSGNLGIVYTTVDFDKVVATMPVDNRTKQPFGLLHGGASVALAESLASIGAWFNVDEKKFNVVGIEINANHIRGVKEGIITGTAIPLHKGQRTHIWETKITDEKGKLVCVSRCTLAIVEIA